MVHLIDVYNGYPGAAVATRTGAVEFLYGLLLERPAEANISHRVPPSYAEHTRFVLDQPYRHWYMIHAEREWVGAIYATHQNEIGIAIGAKYRRRGYAAQAITALRLAHDPLPAIPARRPDYWVAHVAPGNEPSRRLFEALGAKPIAVTYQLP